MPEKSRIYLSSPHMGDLEQVYVNEAFSTNWIAPVGPHVDAFEREVADLVGAGFAVALSSGTAALHLGLQLLGVGPGDNVLVSDLTFVASVSPVRYLGAEPTFIDSDRSSWNMDPGVLADTLKKKARQGRLPKAVVVVHLYGQSADLDPIIQSCEQYGVPLLEDAAEALGATYKARAPGTLGAAGVYSFNGNKIITTSAGGMLVSDDEGLINAARQLSTQARDPAPHYEHSLIGYNYRMSNVLAGIGRGQLAVLEERVLARRRNFEFHQAALGDLPGLEFMPEASTGRHTRWLTTLTIDETQLGVDREAVRLAMEAENIEARPVWRPMHLQPVFDGCEVVGGEVSESLFAAGLCLPSGSNLSTADLQRVVDVFRSVVRA